MLWPISVALPAVLAPAQSSRRWGRSTQDVLLQSLPGAGKSIQVHCLATILPEMTLAESIDATRNQLIAGLNGNGSKRGGRAMI
jgi:hypothetical protein